MEKYEKYKTVNYPLRNPFLEIIGKKKYNVAEVRLSSYSILNKVIGFATKKLKEENTDLIVLIGQDKAIEMTKKCAEILQRNFKGLHQCNATSHKVHEDIWVPKNIELNLDCISVKRHLPVLFILLSKKNLPEQLQFHPLRLQLKTEKFYTDNPKSDYKT